VERLIASIRSKFLDHTLFCNALDLERKLANFQLYFNEYRVHSSLLGKTPAEVSKESITRRADPHRCRGAVLLDQAGGRRHRLEFPAAVYSGDPESVRRLTVSALEDRQHVAVRASRRQCHQVPEVDTEFPFR
jgi:hypothetical protein